MAEYRSPVAIKLGLRPLIVVSFLFCLTYGNLARAQDNEAHRCGKPINWLLEQGYRFEPALSLLHAHAEKEERTDLVILLKFYRLKTWRGGLSKVINITYRLVRYRLTRNSGIFVSERSGCHHVPDFQHQRGFLNAAGGLYLYHRKTNRFSHWPKEPQEQITWVPIAPQPFKLSALTHDIASNRTYASYKKSIYRSLADTKFHFKPWIDFGDLYDPPVKWNPLQLRVIGGMLHILVTHWQPGSRNSYEHLILDRSGKLQQRQSVDRVATYHFHPGPRSYALRLKTRRPAQGQLRVRQLEFTDLKSKKTSILPFPNSHRITGGGGILISPTGTIHILYRSQATDGEPIGELKLWRYWPKRRTHSELPLRLP